MSMDYSHVDNLSADQLLEDDLIEIDDEVVRIRTLSFVGDSVVIEYENEFSEREIQEFLDTKIFKLFVLV